MNGVQYRVDQSEVDVVQESRTGQSSKMKSRAFMIVLECVQSWGAVHQSVDQVIMSMIRVIDYTPHRGTRGKKK